MKEVTLSPKDQQRLKVLQAMERNEVTGEEAARLLGRSVRQVRRLLAAYRDRDVAALPHGNRGRSPAHRTPDAVRAQVLALARDRYPGANFTHLAELLEEREGLTLSRATVRRILREAGLRPPRPRRPPRHRSRRERAHAEGALVQVDGSSHDWLAGRGPWLTLMAAIDDATGRVLAAHFRPTEDRWGYLALLQEIAATKGVPLAVYGDRHGALWHHAHERESLAEQLAGRREPTQVGRVLEELGVHLIHARSPQGKGRVERLFGTFQDRLVAELRWADAATLEDANAVLAAFLPGFNARFGVAPAQSESAYRPWPRDVAPERVFCLKARRKVAADHAVHYHGRVWQIFPTPERRSYARATVEVQEREDGTITILYQGRVLPAALRPAPPAMPTASPPDPAATPVARTGSARPPAPNHPWRRTVTLSRNR